MSDDQNAKELIKRIDEICDKAKQRDLTDSEAEECDRLTERIEELQG